VSGLQPTGAGCLSQVREKSHVVELLGNFRLGDAEDRCPRWPLSLSDEGRRFEAAHRWYTQTLKDEAVRRAHEGVRKLVLYKGQPVFY